MNLAELQQKVDRVIHNADEFVRKWVEFISAPAGTVTLEYYDQNGNLKTASFSNRNKLVQDFIANANRVMSKTVYVDQVNGDDGNDGSVNAPFKTIKKAVDSVPAGGFVEIILLSDHEIANEPGNIFISNKAVLIDTNGFILRKTNTEKRFICLFGFAYLRFKEGCKITVSASDISVTNHQKALVHIENPAFGFIDLGWDDVVRCEIQLDTHLVVTTRSIGWLNAKGCDFRTINNASGLYILAVVDGGDAFGYGTANTGIDGTNIIGLSGRIHQY